MTKKSPPPLPELHRRYNPCEMLLRDIVSIIVFGTDYKQFSVNLTRVPCINETIAYEASTYKVVAVHHDPVDNDGRASCGSHAILYTEPIQDEDPPTAPSKGKRIYRTKSLAEKVVGMVS